MWLSRNLGDRLLWKRESRNLRSGETVLPHALSSWQPIRFPGTSELLCSQPQWDLIATGIQTQVFTVEGVTLPAGTHRDWDLNTGFHGCESSALSFRGCDLFISTIFLISFLWYLEGLCNLEQEMFMLFSPWHLPLHGCFSIFAGE